MDQMERVEILREKTGCTYGEAKAALEESGAGLGLSIADWIVTRHGGHMEVYSWEGVGSRFTIVLA